MLSMPEWTGSSTPSHSAGAVCSLSDILETTPIPRKYYLSRKCCLGIIRRAERRSKEIPPLLRAALLSQAGIRSEAELAAALAELDKEKEEPEETETGEMAELPEIPESELELPEEDM